MPEKTLEVALLGPTQIRYDGSVVGAKVPPKTVALLAFILLDSRRRVERDATAFALWPDEPKVKALANLRRYLYRLNTDLLPASKRPWLTTTARFIAWSDEMGVRVDVADFESASTPPVDVERVLDLYRGELLQNFDEPWIEPLRARLHERFAAAGHAALEHIGNGHARSEIALAKRLIEHDPLDEVAVRALIRRRIDTGDRLSALREYDVFRKLAREEFEVEPSEETQALHEQIVADLRPAVAANDVDERFARLPLIATPLFGREAERDSIGELLADHALVTLLGIGGIGKTRLAVDVATGIIDLFPGGVAFVDVARAERDERLLYVFAEALGVSALTRPDDVETRTVAALAAEGRIVIVDNCERQPESVARLLNRIVPVSGNSRFIVTTREQLDLDGEIVHRVPPLDRESSMALFIDRVQHSRSAEKIAPPLTFEPSAVNTIVARLDGIPLALELAASRAATVGLTDLSSRLAQAIGLDPYRRGRPPRRKTMGAVLDWSYACLDAETARVFRYLSTFAGAWTVERACATFVEFDDEAVRFSLGDLVDAALVVVDRSGEVTRYRFLEPIRAYAAARLVEAGEAPLAYRRHADAVLHTAEQFVDAGRSLPMATRVVCAKAEIDDLRKALLWALSDGNDVELGQRLAAASMYFLFVAPDEGRAYVFEALRAVDTGSSLYTRAKLHYAHARHARQGMRYAEALEAAERAIELARAIGDEDLLCSLTNVAAIAAIAQRRLGLAESLAIECIALARAHGHRHLEWQARSMLPIVVSQRGDYDRARSLFRELLADGGVPNQGHAVDDLANFAENEFLAGRVDEAVRLSAEAIAIAEDIGELLSLRHVRLNHCVFLCAVGRFTEARALALQTIDDTRQAGLGALVLFVLGSLAEIAEERGLVIESAAIAAYVTRRLEAEGFVRDGAVEFQAARLEARLQRGLGLEALARAAERAATWDEDEAIEIAAAASAEASEPVRLAPTLGRL